MTQEELEKVKEAAKFCLMDGDYLKAFIIPHEGEFHVITEGGGRHIFTTQEAACMWASAYFMVASVMPTAEEMRTNRQEE